MSEPIIATIQLDSTSALDTLTSRPDVQVIHSEQLPPAQALTPGSVTLPMNAQTARRLCDEGGYLTVVLSMDLDDLVAAARSFGAGSENTEEDIIHDAAFDFGIPCDCSWRVLGVVDEYGVIVSYTTNVTDELNDEES